jgi:hypothetical protein
METGLFEIQADHLREFRQARQVLQTARKAVVYAMFERLDSISYNRNSASHHPTNATEVVPSSEASPIGPAVDPNVELARCFLRLANLPNFALDRLSRYEATLLAPSRPDPACPRCLGSMQTRRKKTPLPRR